MGADLPENPNELYLEDDKGKRVATGLPKEALEGVVAQGGSVAVISPRGERGTVPVGTLKEALGAGFQLEGREGHHERVLEEKYGDSPIRTFAERALGVATFGVSDIVAGADKDLAEGMREREKRNKGAAILGNVAGALSPVGAAGAIARLGKGAEVLVGGSQAVKALAGGGAAARAGAAVLPAAARLGAEGALFGVQGGISHVALSDHPMSAEAIIGTIGSSALFGAGLGAAAGAVGAGIKPLLSKAGAEARAAADAYLAKAAKAEEGGAAAVAAEGAATKLQGARKVNAQTKGLGARAGEAESDAFAMLGRAEEAAPAKAVSKGDDLLAKIDAKSQELKDTFQRFESASSKYNFAPGRTRPIPKSEWHPSDVAVVEEIAPRLEALQGELAALTKEAGVVKTAAGWQRFDGMLDVNKSVKKGGRYVTVKEQVPNVVGRPSETAAGLGEITPTAQGLAGPTVTPVVPAKGPASLAPTDAAAALGGVGARPADAAGDVFSQLGAKTGAPAAAKPTMLAKLVDAARDKAVKFGAQAAVGAVVGGHVADNPLAGAAVAALSGRLGGTVARAGKAISAGIDGFLKVGPTAGRAAAPAALGVLAATSFAAQPPPQPGPKPKAESVFKQRQRELSSVVQVDPAGKAVGLTRAAQVDLHDRLAGVRAVDPMLGDQLEDHAAKRAQFLYDKMPKAPDFGVLDGHRWQPPQKDVDRWARYVAAAENPERIHAELRSGQLTLETVETVKALYPTMFEGLKTGLMNRIGELRKELSYHQRLQMSHLFDVPVDASMRPEFIHRMQATYAMAREQQQQQAPGNPGKLSKPQPTQAQRLMGGTP